jgi:diadenosine tetraphosphatase ApaH/serine/threonine PP2A family protein phosphatase
MAARCPNVYGVKNLRETVIWEHPLAPVWENLTAFFEAHRQCNVNCYWSSLAENAPTWVCLDA